MAEYKYNRDACQQDRPKGVTALSFYSSKTRSTTPKGTVSFVSQNTIPVKLNKGGKSTAKVRSVITTTRSEVTPFPRPTNAYCVLRRLFQKSSTKQGLKFKLSTNDLSSEKKDGKVVIVTESVKDGEQKLVRDSQIP